MLDNIDIIYIYMHISAVPIDVLHHDDSGSILSRRKPAFDTFSWKTSLLLTLGVDPGVKGQHLAGRPDSFFTSPDRCSL